MAEQTYDGVGPAQTGYKLVTSLLCGPRPGQLHKCRSAPRRAAAPRSQRLVPGTRLGERRLRRSLEGCLRLAWSRCSDRGEALSEGRLASPDRGRLEAATAGTQGAHRVASVPPAT